MTKAQAKEIIKERNSKNERVVDWDWRLWKDYEMVTVISISIFHTAIKVTYTTDSSGNLVCLRDTIQCM